MKAAGDGTDGGTGTYAALGFGAFGADALASLPGALSGVLGSLEAFAGAGWAPPVIHAGVAAPAGAFHAFAEAPSLPAAHEYPPMPPAMQVMGAHEIAQGHLAFDF